MISAAIGVPTGGEQQPCQAACFGVTHRVAEKGNLGDGFGPSDPHEWDGEEPNVVYSITVFGASGDLAKRKLFPAFLSLFHHHLVPRTIQFVGFGRTHYDSQQFRELLSSTLLQFSADNSIPYIPTTLAFLSKVHYVIGDYASSSDIMRLAKEIGQIEQHQYLHQLEKAKSRTSSEVKSNRVFYFSLPPSVYAVVSKQIGSHLLSTSGWNRVVVEKPFGSDEDSSNALQKELSQFFDEDMIFRIDHYLGKEMVMNLLTLRFANTIFEPLWNRHYIKAIVISFKEKIGIEGRAGYFDNYGIIRDVPTVLVKCYS
ncbi:glucose-6-phosphate dehydrogenase [Pelomyxa schiedti]|nr:glucose-6-phosphate dehydrogenase [Pelomyxa schiedti]